MKRRDPMNARLRQRRDVVCVCGHTGGDHAPQINYSPCLRCACALFARRAFQPQIPQGTAKAETMEDENVVDHT